MFNVTFIENSEENIKLVKSYIRYIIGNSIRDSCIDSLDTITNILVSDTHEQVCNNNNKNIIYHKINYITDMSFNMYTIQSLIEAYHVDSGTVDYEILILSNEFDNKSITLDPMTKILYHISDMCGIIMNLGDIENETLYNKIKTLKSNNTNKSVKNMRLIVIDYIGHQLIINPILTLHR